MRMICVFGKDERIRHIGHLDLMRAMQRALRRSGLPIGYSKGFNPHVLVTFASALSVGAYSEREIMDVTLEEPEGVEVSAEEFLAVMNRALPPELQLKAARRVDNRHPAVMAMVTAAGYTLTILDETNKHAFDGMETAFLAQESISAERKTKSGIKEVDIKPLIRSLQIENGVIGTVLALSERDTCKPDMLLKALSRFAGIEEAPRIRVLRTQLYGCTEAGELAPLEDL